MGKESNHVDLNVGNVRAVVEGNAKMQWWMQNCKRKNGRCTNTSKSACVNKFIRSIYELCETNSLPPFCLVCAVVQPRHCEFGRCEGVFALYHNRNAAIKQTVEEKNLRKKHSNQIHYVHVHSCTWRTSRFFFFFDIYMHLE